MQPTMSLKFLVEECVKGNFQNVYKYITSKRIDFDLETHSAIRIIVGVCNACHKNLLNMNRINEWDLTNLVKCVLKYIQIPSNEQYECYAQSAFYILKLLIEKKSFDCIVELQDLFIPEFMPLILTEKHRSIYQSICRTIYNVIVRVAQGQEQAHTDVVIKLSYLLVAVYKKIDNKVSLLEGVHNCILALIMLGATPGKVARFYQDVVIPKDRAENLSLYPLLINNFSCMYSHLLKTEHFSLATTCYKTTGEQVKILFKGSEFLLLWDIMDIIEWVNPGNINNMTTQRLHQIHTNLKIYHRKYKSTANLQSVCDLISSVAFIVLQFNKKTNQWGDKTELHTHYYKFLSDVSLIMAKTPYNCHCKNCPTETNINEALRTLNTIGGLGRLCIVQESDVCSTCKVEILRYLEKSLEYVTILKENSCEKWKKYWYDIGVHLSNISFHLYQKKDNEILIMYLKKFIQGFLEFEELHSRSIVDKNYLITSLITISDLYFKRQDFEKCLLLCALGIITNESPKDEIHRWMRAKMASRDNSIELNSELQQLTLVSICDKYRFELNSYLPKSGLKLDTKRKIELLTYELRQYNLKWKSKIPMCSAYRELCQNASPQFAAEIFIEIWGDGDMAVHDTLPKLLQETISRVAKETLTNKNFLLAHLYFLQHKYRVKDTIVKHCDEMERTITNMAKVEKNVDPNDECDLVSSYECLKLSRYVKMMKELNKSLHLAQDCVSKNFTEVVCDRDRMYKLLVNIGHEYCLHGHVTNSLQAWELALKVAEISKNTLHKLQATSFIMEVTDVQKPLLKKLINEAENSIDTLKKNGNLKELAFYYLCKAQAYFHDDFDIAYTALKKILLLQEKFQGDKILQAKIHLLHHKFIMMPCKFAVAGHREYSLVKIHQANISVNSYYAESPNITSYDMRIFFEVYEALAKMYSDMRLPREVRCFAKDATVIAQKMVLPMRTASFLCYLAYADIGTCRMDDCRVKLKDCSEILGVSRNGSMITPTTVRGKGKMCEVLEKLTSEFSEMMLDVPRRAVPLSCSGSPTFAVEVFKMPPFFNHEECCECFYCTSLEYHQLVLKQRYMTALFYEHENNLAVAKDFFFGCIKIYEHLKMRQDVYHKKIAKRMSVDLVPKPRYKLTETYCTILWEYGNFLMRSKRHVDAQYVNQKTLGILEPYNMHFMYLYNEVLAQKLNIMMILLLREQARPAANVTSVDSEVSATKTPPSHQSRVTTTISVLDDSMSDKTGHIKITPKSLQFDLSDEESTEVQKAAIPKNLPPLNLVNKTPAPSTSKMKVYTNPKSILKKTNMVLTEIPPFKEPLDLFKNCMDAEQSTPSVSAKIDKNLASRTKLLTDRLKNSSRKDDKCSSSKETDENAKRKAVRQNLLSQLDEAERDGGELRRSARNRK